MKSATHKNREFRSSLCLTVLIVSILAAGGAFAQPSATERTGAPKAARPNDSRTPLALSEFLSQVAEKHTGYKASGETARAAKLYSSEGNLLFRPTLSGSATATADGQTNPFTSDTGRTNIKNYNLGVGQQTDFGLSGKISYNRLEMEVPRAGTYQPDWIQLDLSQSLLRNWGGRESRAQAEAATSGALAKSYGQSYATKAVFLEAESAYWRLALARELVFVQKDAVERALRISEWTNRRVRLQLADRAEFLQASSNLQARRLDLRNAEDEERAASQAFNSSRGLSGDKVDEKLVDISPELIAKMTAPARTNTRDDVKAAEYQAKASAASSTLARERNTPTLELFGSAPVVELAGVNPSNALAASLPSTSRPATTVGLRVVAPLDFGTLSKAREGYAAEAAAADFTYQRKVFEEERDWSDLTAKFKQAKQRLDLYRELESTQKQKLDYERDRHQRGRTTLQQVLFFETDYEQAQLGRIRTIAEILTLNAQMKLYGVSYESR